MSEIEHILSKSGAILNGHFLLSSGRHSGQYVQCSRLFEDTQYSKHICGELKEKLGYLKIDVIIGPAIGAILLSYEMGRQLKCRNMFAEREDGKMTLRRGYNLKKGDRVVIVEDVITTAGSVNEVIELVESRGSKIQAILSIINRNIDPGFSYPYFYLTKLDIPSYDESECPFCKAGELPLVKPGSRKF